MPARKEFEAALGLDREFGPAELDMAETLIEQRQSRIAISLLQKAEHSALPDIAQRAHAILQQLGP